MNPAITMAQLDHEDSPQPAYLNHHISRLRLGFCLGRYARTMRRYCTLTTRESGSIKTKWPLSWISKCWLNHVERAHKACVRLQKWNMYTCSHNLIYKSNKQAPQRHLWQPRSNRKGVAALEMHQWGNEDRSLRSAFHLVHHDSWCQSFAFVFHACQPSLQE